MTKILYLDYVSLIIYVLIIIALISRTKRSLRKRDVFSLLIVVALFATIYDICAVLVDNHGEGAVTLKYILHIGYLILRNLITPVMGAYVIDLTDTWHRLYKRKLISVLIWIPFSFVAIMTLLSPFTKLVFYIDDADRYTRGPWFFILYVSAIFYTGYCVFHVIKYIDTISMDKFIPLISIAPNQMIAVVVQYYFPNVLCEMLATALCMLLIMLTVEKPDGRVDQSTALLKSMSFYEDIQKSFTVKKPMAVLLVNITNHAALSSYISFSQMDSIYREIGLRVNAIEEQVPADPSIYNLDNGLLAITIPNDKVPYAARFARYTLDALKTEFQINYSSVAVLANVCVLKYPEDIQDMDSLGLVVNDLRHSKYTGEIIMASTFTKSKDYKAMANMDAILTNAIENDLFEVYYQPIYSVEEKRFNSAEALIRLNTKEYGFIRPDLFIPMAEDSGQIHQIGMIVFEKVCKFIASDHFKDLGIDYIEVNISVAQFMDHRLSEKLLKVMDTYSIKPSQLNLEVTETASSFVQKNMMTNMDTLHERGISFSLDDFGTGYSNMVRIASLPLHIVKLDKSFTWTENNADLRLILENTINMVKKMNMKIVVEGVETEEMLNTFSNLGCEYIQGYYFSKPLPEYDFVKFIQENK